MKQLVLLCAGLIVCTGEKGLDLPAARAADVDLSAVDLARKLNQAFVEVAERVSPAVVVVQVAHTEDFRGSFEEDHPFWDLLPRDLQKELQEQWKNRTLSRRCG